MWRAFLICLCLLGIGCEPNLNVGQTVRPLEREFNVDDSDFQSIWVGERVGEVRLDPTPTGFADGDYNVLVEVDDLITPDPTGRWVRVGVSHVHTQLLGITTGYVLLSFSVTEWHED